MLVHSRSKPVKTPVSGNGSISEPFELLHTEPGVKAGVRPLSHWLYIWNAMAVVKHSSKHVLACDILYWELREVLISAFRNSSIFLLGKAIFHS